MTDKEKTYIKCPDCHGRGWDENMEWVRCSRCGGYQWILTYNDEGDGDEKKTNECI